MTISLPNEEHSHRKVEQMKKRKEFEHDLASISPPPKSRRLEWECEVFSTMMVEEENAMMKQECVDPTKPASEERALVLYDPTATTPFVRSPTSPQFSIVVKADLIPGLKDYLFSWGTAKRDDLIEEEIGREKSSEVSNDCLAVVPWVAFHSPMACEEIVQQTGQPLEVEEGDMMEMD